MTVSFTFLDITNAEKFVVVFFNYWRSFWIIRFSFVENPSPKALITSMMLFVFPLIGSCGRPGVKIIVHWIYNVKVTSFAKHSPKIICVLVQFNHCFLKVVRDKLYQRVTVLVTWMSMLLFENCDYIQVFTVFHKVLSFRTIFKIWDTASWWTKGFQQ